MLAWIFKENGKRVFVINQLNQVKYIAHVCCRPNTNLTKLSLFYTPKASYYCDPWINISSLLGDISIEQAKQETQLKTGLIILLQKHYSSVGALIQ